MVHFPQTSIIFEYFAFKCAFTEKFSFLRKGIDKRLVKIKIIHIDSFGCWCCIIRCTTFVFHYGFYAILCINLIPIESMLFPDRYGCSGEGAERREADEGRSDNGLHPVAHRCAPLQRHFPACHSALPGAQSKGQRRIRTPVFSRHSEHSEESVLLP